MEKSISHIDLVFENCDVCSLEPDMFAGLVISGIKRRYMINCFQYEKGEALSYIDCEKFEILINKKGQRVKTNMSDEVLKKRLWKYNDLTHIHLYFTDGTNEYITVPWEGGLEENQKQIARMVGDELEVIIR